uniref:PRC-barrel domain-containing protein n=1 Tax=Faecalibacterium prausnitzii TaxID=853 RepID=UPI0040290238
MTFRELCSKEVVQLKDGACLGRVDDLELDADTARIGSLLLLGRPRLFGLLGRDETLTIPWADIERIGLDAILVRTDIPAPPPSHGGLLDKFHQWLNGRKIFTRYLSVRAGIWRQDD